jgi:hypothetical protein
VLPMCYMTIGEGSKELWSDAEFLHSTLNSFADWRECLIRRFLSTDWVFGQGSKSTFLDIVREVTEELIPSNEVVRDYLDSQVLVRLRAKGRRYRTYAMIQFSLERKSLHRRDDSSWHPLGRLSHPLFQILVRIPSPHCHHQQNFQSSCLWHSSIEVEDLHT